MKKFVLILAAAVLLFSFAGCSGSTSQPLVAATTMPVYYFTSRLCQDTPITVTQLVTESVSCLHDYTLQVSQMRTLENAEMVVISGAGLELFLEDVLSSTQILCDSSVGIELICYDHNHEHEHSHEQDHSHENDPHVWLAPKNAKIMAQNICSDLSSQFPEYRTSFNANLATLLSELDALQAYGEETLAQLKKRELITFHDGFSYFAQAFDLTILEAVEEESGSEASAADLIHLIETVNDHSLRAIFTEITSSDAAASIIAAETGTKVYKLSMVMSGSDYFTEMYQNIDTIKEALG